MLIMQIGRSRPRDWRFCTRALNHAPTCVWLGTSMVET